MRRTIYLFLIAVVFISGCKQLNRFHENELTLEVNYINDILDEVSDSFRNEEIELLSRHFITDSSLNWSLPGVAPNNSGWSGFSRNIEIHFRVRSDMERVKRERIINIDELGNIAWFMEENDVFFTAADSNYSYYGAVTSGVLTKSGDQWLIVQWHESY